MTVPTQVREYMLDAILLVKTTIDNNPFSKTKITDLIEISGIGRNSLQEKFKLLTGKTITRYRLEKRMEKAKEILVGSRQSIKQVSLKCGYRKSDRFCIDFKKIYQVSPTEFKKRQLHFYNGYADAN